MNQSDIIDRGDFVRTDKRCSRKGEEEKRGQEIPTIPLSQQWSSCPKAITFSTRLEARERLIDRKRQRKRDIYVKLHIFIIITWYFGRPELTCTRNFYFPSLSFDQQEVKSNPNARSVPRASKRERRPEKFTIFFHFVVWLICKYIITLG